MKKIIISILFIISCCSTLFPAELRLTLFNAKLLPVNNREFHSACKQIFRYECQRLEFDVTINIKVILKNYSQMEIRGEAIPDSSRIYIYIDSSYTKKKLFGIFAHELAHILHFRWIKSYQGGSRYFDEGFACWLAGDYFLKWQQKENFISAIKQIDNVERFDINNQIDEKILPPPQRDIMYIEWGSFVEYLINSYGLKRIQDFCKNLSLINMKQQGIPITLTDEEMKKQRALFENKSREQIEKDGRWKKWIDELASKYIKKSNDLMDEEYNSVYLKIFGVGFDELKSNWLKSIAI